MHPDAIPAPSQEVPEGVYFDLEREIWLLRSTIAYHDAFGFYPFDSFQLGEDFCQNWVQMTLGEQCTEFFNLRKKYDERLEKKFQDLTPREQEALEMGNKIWGSIDAPGPMLAPFGKENKFSSEAHNSGKEDEGVNQDSMFSEKGYSSGEEGREDDQDSMFTGEDDEVEEEEQKQKEEGLKEILDQIPLLRESFQFGANITDDMKIPVVSADVVKDGLAALGSENLEQWNKEWGELMVEELEIFLKMVNMIKNLTVLLLAQMKTE